MKRYNIVILIFILAFVFLSNNEAFTQRPGKDYQLYDTKGKPYSGPGFVMGSVNYIEKGKINLGGEHNFDITDKTKIIHNGKEVPFNFIKNGDQVRITYLFPGMEAIKIELLLK